jgi:hypothetical protein
MPIERRVAHLIDMARALSYAGLDDEALQQLLSAEHEAPTLVRESTSVRERIKAMHRRSPVTAGRRSSELIVLAERCRAVA